MGSRVARYLKKCLFEALSSSNGAAASSYSSSSSRLDLDLRRRNGFDIRRNYTTSVSKKPLITSISLTTVKDKYLNFSLPGLEKTEGDEGRLCVYLNMPGVKEEDVKVRLESNTLLSIRGKIHDESYFGGLEPTQVHRAFMELPDNIDRNTSTYKIEMQQDGMFKLTLPKLKGSKQLRIFSNIITYIRFKFSVRLYASIPSFIMTFARPFVVNLLCSQLYESFTMYKKETAQTLHISVTPGLQNLDPVMGGALCVSLNMPELELEDVNLFFKCDTFFIQGKAKTKTSKVQYITGIRLPDFFERSRKMIKEEMRDGMYKATIPIVT